MKTMYGKLLRSLAIGLFSLTLSGALEAATAAETYESQIASALSRSSIGEKIEALNGLAAVMGNINPGTAQEINPEFTSALTAVYGEAQNDPSTYPALRVLLTNASNVPVLDANQKATIAQWISGITPQTAIGFQSGLSSEAAVMNRIAEINAAGDDSKRLEAIYELLQDAHGRTYSPLVQEAFGKLIQQVFNDVSDAYSYLQQTLNEAVHNPTPLLTSQQLDYVENQMLPRIGGVMPSEDAPAAKKDTKGKKGKKGKKGAPAAAAAAVPLDAVATTPSATPASGKKGKKAGKKKGAPATGSKKKLKKSSKNAAPISAAAKPAKGKKAGKKKGKKAAKTGATSAATAQVLDSAPVDTGSVDTAAV